MSDHEASRDQPAPESALDPAVEAEELRFAYRGGGGEGAGDAFELVVPRWRIERGEHVALFGPSGCGKSTLLALLAGVLVARSGRLAVEGRDLRQLGDAERRAHRIRRIGQVFQDSPLLDSLDAEENVLFPFRLNGALRLDAAARRRAVELLGELGLGGKRRRRPAELSQGERQRVGIARALVAEPSLLLADEPTSGLDPEAASRAVELLLRLSAERGLTLLTVTHDPAVRARFATAYDVGAWSARAADPPAGEPGESS